jgi:hypothetical protein
VLAATDGTPCPGIGTISQNVTVIGAGARSTAVDVSSALLDDTAVTGNDDLVSSHLNGGGIFESSGSLEFRSSC